MLSPQPRHSCEGRNPEGRRMRGIPSQNNSRLLPPPSPPYRRKPVSMGRAEGAPPPRTTLATPTPYRVIPAMAEPAPAKAGESRGEVRPRHPDTTPSRERTPTPYTPPMQHASAAPNRNFRTAQSLRPPNFSLTPASASAVAHGGSAKIPEIFVLNLNCGTTPTNPRRNSLRPSYGRGKTNVKRMVGEPPIATKYSVASDPDTRIPASAAAAFTRPMRAPYNPHQQEADS